MFQILARSCLIALIFFTVSSFTNEASTKLRLAISNIETGKGNVMIALYDKEHHWLEQPYRQMVISSASARQQVSFEIPHGKYAVSIFQDLNGNGKLDKGLFGIPKEPIGLGNNHRPSGKPNYKSCIVEHGPQAGLHEVKLYYVLR